MKNQIFAYVLVSIIIIFISCSPKNDAPKESSPKDVQYKTFLDRRIDKELINSSYREAISLGDGYYYYPEADPRLDDEEGDFLLEQLNNNNDTHARKTLDSIIDTKFPNNAKLYEQINTTVKGDLSHLFYHINGVDIFHRNEQDSVKLTIRSDSVYLFIIGTINSGKEIDFVVKINGKEKKFSKKFGFDDSPNFEIKKSFHWKEFYDDSCIYKVCVDTLTARRP